MWWNILKQQYQHPADSLHLLVNEVTLLSLASKGGTSSSIYYSIKVVSCLLRDTKIYDPVIRMQIHYPALTEVQSYSIFNMPIIRQLAVTSIPNQSPVIILNPTIARRIARMRDSEIEWLTVDVQLLGKLNADQKESSQIAEVKGYTAWIKYKVTNEL